MKLIAAMAIQGAIFRAVRGIAEHGARVGFARWTGPGRADAATPRRQRSRARV